MDVKTVIRRLSEKLRETRITALDILSYHRFFEILHQNAYGIFTKFSNRFSKIGFSKIRKGIQVV